MTSLTSIQIQAMVRNMDESLRKYRNLKETNRTLWLSNLRKENEKLATEFPTIFNMHLEGNLDQTFFDMLHLKRKIEKGEITEDEASIEIGQKLFNKYVSPVVNNLPKPSTLSYEEYYKQNATTNSVSK
jgi:hypothetical protein